MTSSPTLRHWPWGQETWKESRLSRVPMVQMNAFWWVVREIYTTWETSTQLCENLCTWRTHKRKNKHMNGRTGERKGENYIPLGINAGGIMTCALNIKLRTQCFLVRTAKTLISLGAQSILLILSCSGTTVFWFYIWLHCSWCCAVWRP